MLSTDYQQAAQIKGDNQELCRHHVDHNRADKETLLALEEHAAGGTMVFDVEQSLDD